MIAFASAFEPERPRANGAAAMSVHESSRPTIAGPRLRRVDGLPVDGRDDHEGGRRDRADEETGAEQEIEAPALDGVADAGENGDDPAREGHDRLEDEPELGQRDLGLQVLIG